MGSKGHGNHVTGGRQKPKSNAKTKSRIAKAGSNSGGGFNRAAGMGGPGKAHEKEMKKG